MAEGFLTPEQVDGLRTKKEILEYGAHIGVFGLEPTSRLADLKIQVNQFIKAAEDDPEDDEDGGNDA